MNYKIAGAKVAKVVGKVTLRLEVQAYQEKNLMHRLWFSFVSGTMSNEMTVINKGILTWPDCERWRLVIWVLTYFQYHWMAPDKGQSRQRFFPCVVAFQWPNSGHSGDCSLPSRTFQSFFVVTFFVFNHDKLLVFPQWIAKCYCGVVVEIGSALGQGTQLGLTPQGPHRMHIDFVLVF